MTDKIITFPGREPPPEGFSAEHVDELHAEAFRSLEGLVCDCVNMSGIAAELMINTRGAREDLNFAVLHLHGMLLNLKKRYERAWFGEASTDDLTEGSDRSCYEIRDQLEQEAKAKDETPPTVA